MTNKDEKKLLLSIKIIPLIIVTALATIGIIVALYINNINFNNEIKSVKELYLKQEKETLKQEILKIRKNIFSEKQLTKEQLKENIKEKVYMAYSITTNIYNKYKDTKSKNEIKEMIKNALVNIRFNDGRGYFFIYSMDYECILLPLSRQLEGTSFYNFKDGKGMYLTREIIKQLKEQKEGFLTWWYHKPDDMVKQYEKIGFNKYFEPLDWFIGTGEYVEDYEEIVKEFITKRLSVYTYKKDSYIFIFNKDGIILAHKDKDMIGKNKLELKHITKEILKTAQNDGGFIEYVLPEKGLNKISYVVPIKDWDWVIGSGFYTNDLNALIENKKKELRTQNQKQMNSIILISIIIIILIIILSLSLSYTIQKRFESYKRKACKKDKMILEQSKMAAMGEMIGNIAHQWRQPLSIISTGATGMKVQKEYGVLSDEEFITICDAINENAQYLSETIDDFRNFIKGDRVKEIFSLEENINSFIHLVEGAIKTNDIKLTLKLEKDIKINGYNNELIQCFINIFNNAKDALKEHTTHDRMIKVTTYSQNNHAVIEMLDNGGGIPENITDKVFEPYFTTKHKSKGTGLGLSMTYKFIVDGMDGTIAVHNKEFEYEHKKYRGTEIKIVLPLQVTIP